MKLSKREYMELCHDLEGLIAEQANEDNYSQNGKDWYDDELEHDDKTYYVEALIRIYDSVGFEFSGHDDHETHEKETIQTSDVEITSLYLVTEDDNIRISYE